MHLNSVDTRSVTISANMRLFLFMLITALELGCSWGQDLDWWQSGSIYQIYPRSFKDSDGDGVGDLKGITSKLDYLVDIGVNTIWLSPVFVSPMKDFGYDISDFRDIDPIFGNMADFEEMVSEMNKKDLNLILDFVPNHSSDEHVWFQKSIQKDPVYADYYVWRNASNATDPENNPPNNWVSVFGGSAWTWNPVRKQFYLHQFHPGQPDLNYENQAVVEELKDIISFWLGKGAQGFRIDAIAHMFEDPEFKDEPKSNRPGITDFEYDYLDHIYTKNYNGTYEVLRELRIVMEEFTALSEDKKHKIMLTEAYESIEYVMRYYGTEAEPIADLPFNFEYLGRFGQDTTGTAIKEAADQWIGKMPAGKWANWVSGNHDNHRVGSKVVSTKLVDAINMMNLLLPGTSITYFGEEIGMVDTELTYEETQDPWGCNFGRDNYTKYSRDAGRTPMQWENSTNAGFSTNDRTWLPVNPNYPTVNVEVQKPKNESHLNIYKHLIEIRKEESIRTGCLSYPLVNDEIFSFTRFLADKTSYVMIVNFGDHANVDISGGVHIPAEATVVIRSVGSMVANVGTVLKTNYIHMGPNESVLLSFTKSASARAATSSVLLLLSAIYCFL